ncbi:MAG: hypothetical protein RR161_02735 [Bacilli bacterium]
MNSKITNLSLCILYFLLMIASFILFDIKNILMSSNAFLVIIFGTLIGLLFNFIYLKLLNKNILYNLLLSNKPLKYIILINILILFSYTINLTSNFISYNLLENVPIFIISFTLIILISLIKKYNLNVILNISNILFYLFLIMVTFIIICLIPQLDLKNISINLTYINIFKESLFYAIIISYPLFLLNIVKNNAITKINKICKQLLGTYLLANGLIITIIFIIINVIGKNVINLYPYPHIIVLKYINYFNVFERMENILSLVWLFCLIIFIIMNVYIIKKILKFKHSNIFIYLTLYIITLIKVNYLVFIYTNIFIFIISFNLYLFKLKNYSSLSKKSSKNLSSSSSISSRSISS